MTGEVVLLHGLGRTKQAMAKMARYLELSGYQVHNIDYPSTEYPIETLVDQVAQQIALLRKDSSRPLHFVVLSLGSIIAHLYIKKYRPENLGRIVALGPPYHGSVIIDHLARYQWYQKLHGPAALQLTTQPQGICHQLGAADYELGVIAGNRYFFADWFFAHCWLKPPNDGKVEVASTYITGCRERIILPVNHVLFASYPIVIQQACHFLNYGNFDQKR